MATGNIRIKTVSFPYFYVGLPIMFDTTLVCSGVPHCITDTPPNILSGYVGISLWLVVDVFPCKKEIPKLRSSWSYIGRNVGDGICLLV